LKEGNPEAENRHRILHFGAATHVACRLVPARSSRLRVRFEFGNRAQKRLPLPRRAFARATAERSVAGMTVEGMAPRLGGHDARESVYGAAKAESYADNADRGGSLARRRIESSCGCARASQRTAEVGCSGLLAPIEASLEKRPRSRRHEETWAGASFVGTPRAQ